MKRTEEEKTCKNQSDLLFVYSGRGNGCEVSVFDVGCWGVCVVTLEFESEQTKKYPNDGDASWGSKKIN